MIPLRGYLAAGLLALVLTGMYGAYRHGVTVTDNAWTARHAEALAAQAAERDILLTERERRRAALAAQLKAAQDENDARDGRIAAGIERVYVRASCPELPATPANAGRAGAGAAELDPAYRHTLSQLRRAADQQLALLNLCRAELQLRSAPR